MDDGMNQSAGKAALNEHERGELCQLIEQSSGIVFDESRERFFTSRVAEHMHTRGLANGSELLRLVRRSTLEYDTLLERLLTQETRFFRYPGLFAALQQQVLPELQKSKFWERESTIRVWSAGCASGEEPYSIALCAAEAGGPRSLTITATDISREALERAARGIYPARVLENLTPEQIRKYFQPDVDGFAVSPGLRALVRFAMMNLAQPVYLGRFECIFCMNVLIYFGDELRTRLIKRFFDTLVPGGYLFLGHAESVANVPVQFCQTFLNGVRLLQRPREIAGGMQ